MCMDVAFKLFYSFYFLRLVLGMLVTDFQLDRGDMFGSVEDGVDSGVYAQDDGRGDMADAGGAGDR